MILFTAIATFSCSVEKNTGATRSYHNLVSHYNIYFNGKESFLEGLERARESHIDNYNEILPLFYYEDEAINQTVSPQMKRTIDKATKVITFHSIKSKPKIKKGRQTAKDKAFYDKNEYNKWIDDCYMLIGKSYMYQGEFFLAAETFKHVIKNFREEPLYYNALAWLVRANNVIGDLSRSEEIIVALRGVEEFPKEYREEIYTSFADYYIRLNDYDKAADYLSKALKSRPNKSRRIRYHYILAQLYNADGEGSKSIDKYKKVIRMNPPYVMAFNAKVSMAEAFQAGESNSSEITKLLYKMLKDTKNDEFQDQIYYALGNIYMEEGKREQAIEYYHLSVTNSVQNNFQKGESCLTLADIYYNEPEYALSAAYYDTAVNLLDADYRGYRNLQLRSASLNTLVHNLNIVQLQDSLQKLAEMTESERLAVIDEIISEINKKEEEERLRKQEAIQDFQYSRTDLINQPGSGMNNRQGSSKWYFYNLNLKSYGQPEFRMKWGERKLEDNWRRGNKLAVSELTEQESEMEMGSLDPENSQIIDLKSREYYLKDIPFSDSAIEVSHLKLEEALYNAGMVYKDDLLDYKEAIHTFEALIERYPKGNFNMAAYFYLYDLYNTLKDGATADYYKNRLSSEYPKSHMAMLLTNPNYINELEAEHRKEQDFYEQVYDAYVAGHYNEVIQLADKGLKEYGKNREIKMRLSFLKAMSSGATQGKEAMKQELDSVIARYPGTEIAEEAQQVINYMYKAFPVIKEIEQVKEAEELYTYEPEKDLIFLLALKRAENMNLVNFNLLNYNLDNFNAYDLQIKLKDFGEDYNLLMIDSFANTEGLRRYFERVKADINQIVGEIPEDAYEIVLISESNYEKLLREKEFIPYMLFYREKYQE